MSENLELEVYKDLVIKQAEALEKQSKVIDFLNKKISELSEKLI